MPEGMVALFIASFIGIPIAVETGTCYHPSPKNEGVVCNWKEKDWVKGFDLKTKEHYYTLKEYDENDNFIERAMRKRYLDKGGRYVTKTKEETVNRRKMDRRSI